jgi:2-polyprenyl-3-methyl-5-hydroxy-6-metoxy-1,4-benzoquinol methylase
MLLTSDKTSDEMQTIKSFNYQWANLSNAKNILADDSWRQNVDSYVLDELQASRDWIKGKSVIDVGCGGGRWSYGFAKLGCQVTATDISDAPCVHTRQHVPQAQVIKSDLFELPDVLKDTKFDIVWCWGVIHHTADPQQAFKILTNLMNNDGLLHIYVYSFDRGMKVRILRKLLSPFSFKQKEKLIGLMIKIGVLHGDVHEWFDALSPKINYEINESDLQKWFNSSGLNYKRYTPQWAKESGDIFATGWKIPDIN